MRLVRGDPEKLEAGLRHFSSFAKLSYIFNFFEDFNGRIRETALIVAMDLWQFDELKADIQAMIMSSNEVCKTEHALVTRLLDTDERAMNIMTHEFEDEELNALVDEKVADLVSQQCEHRANELTNLVHEHKSDSKT